MTSLGACAALGTLLIGGVANAGARVSIAIGNNIGWNSDVALKWAERDAQRFDAVLGEIGEVPEPHRQLVLGGDAAEIATAFEAARAIVGADPTADGSLLVVFYSGHGDASSLHVARESLPLDELQRLTETVGASATILIVDACHSGQLVRGRSKGLQREPEFEVSLVRQVAPTGRLVLTSSGSDEVAQESDSLQSSYFTHHLLTGLRGAADADLNGVVTVAEAYSYVYHRTVVTSHRDSGATQHPHLDTDLAGEGELVLSTLDHSQSTLVLDQAIRGSVLVVDDRSGQVVAEMHKAAGAVAQLAIPSGRYRIQVRDGGTVLSAEAPMHWGGRTALTKADMTEVPLELALSKGPALDTHAWSAWATGGVAQSSDAITDPGWFVGLGAQRALAIGWHGHVELRGGSAQGRSPDWSFSTRTLEGRIGAGPRWDIGPITTSTTAALGVAYIAQTARRRDAERLRRLTDTKTRETTWGAGGFFALNVSAWMPITGGFSVGVSAGARAMLLSKAGDSVVEFGSSLGAAIAYEL